MVPSAVMRAAGAAALVAGAAQAYTHTCVYETDGANPTIDLNLLYNPSADYEVTSLQNDAYVYHFNLCGETVFTDSSCGSGASVCEVKDSVGQDVYGYVDSIGLHWENSNLVLTQSGQVQCPFNQMNTHMSRIYFSCSSDGTTSVSLRTEAYYQCLLEFDFVTPKACGGVQAQYRCDDNTYTCVLDDNGAFGDYDSCKSGCVAPPPPPPPPGDYYVCSSDFVCQSSEYGNFRSYDDCTSLCAPFQARYSCYQQRCVRNSRGNYTSEGACVSACSAYANAATAWACVDGTCTEDATGPFASEADCEQGCAGAELNHHTDAAAAPGSVAAVGGGGSSSTSNAAADKAAETDRAEE